MTTKDTDFWEAELKTPEHDKIVLWCFSNATKIIKELGLFKEEEFKESDIKKVIEYPIQNNRYNIGFVDLMFLIDSKQGEKFILLEIKPTINSVGEVMRQINRYRSYQHGIYVLVSKTTGLEEIFKSQNVFYYQYKDS